MHITYQKVKLSRGKCSARLVFADGVLVAVLSHLSPEFDAFAGHWFFEVGFGELDDVESLTFANWTKAKAWMATRLTQGPGDKVKSRYHYTGQYTPTGRSIRADATRPPGPISLGRSPPS
ncbi:MAG: hypothetical protein ABW003_07705 [Microvirga sp.]